MRTLSALPRHSGKAHMTPTSDHSVSPYHGRFAPTPSGPLHFGSVVAALGSYLRARSCGGRWSLRIDDLDRPRVQADATDTILRDLDRLGLHWDNAPVFQSTRLDRYQAALAQLRERDLTFPCGCTRAEVRGVYPGTCRKGLPPGRRGRSIRLRVPARPVAFTDVIQGTITTRVAETTGDFILRRADGIIAYHLAAIIDDAEAGFTEIVRGADLLDSTPPQILLQQLLDLPSPGYLHLPVALDERARKISKQNRAPAIAEQRPADVLCDTLEFLGQQPELALRGTDVAEIHAWAQEHWRLDKVPRVAERPYIHAATQPPR
jgi:glutamyl-Q tRNA(Asp) synthetase